jgi:hypothetical protein
MKDVAVAEAEEVRGVVGGPWNLESFDDERGIEEKEKI